MSRINQRVMNEYGELVKDLKLPVFMSDFVTGKLPCPFRGVSSPPYYWGFPPVLIPIWSDNGLVTYHGIWKHWFLNRNVSFVELRCRREYRAVEIARTAQQFAQRLVLQKLYLRDRVDAEVERLANAVGVQDLDLLTRIAFDPRPDEVKLAEHPAFSCALPQEMCEHVGMPYDGEFPFEKSSQSIEDQLSNCCSFEFSQYGAKNPYEQSQVSEWSAGGNKLHLFEKCLDQRDFAAAWLCLNSRGWELGNAQEAIADLAAICGDQKFKRLAKLWCELPKEDFMGYEPM